MKLEELVKELLKEGLYCKDVDYDAKTDSLCYSILGFAKSGYGELIADESGRIHLMTRYGQDNVIESIKDFIDVGYIWDKNYCSKDSLYCNSYGVGNEWKKLYVKYGYDISIFS